MPAADAEARVRALLERAIAAGMIPGAVAGWGRAGDGMRTVAVGRAAIQPRPRPTDGDVQYDVASLTKVLVTTPLALIAAREGKLDLDAPVADVLTEARATEIGVARVRHLLAHTSGLPAWRPLYALVDRPQRAIEAICASTLESVPGERVAYSDLGFLLLGAVIERALGGTLPELACARLFEPLGLAPDTAAFRPDRATATLAAGSDRPLAEEGLCIELGLDSERIPADADHLPDDGNARFLTGAAATAGLFATITGAIRLAAESVPGGGEVLRADDVARAVSRQTPSGQLARGLGWQLGADAASSGDALPPDAWGHTGFTGTSVWVDPRSSLVMCLLTNRHHPRHRGVDLHPLRRAFHRAVLSA